MNLIWIDFFLDEFALDGLDIDGSDIDRLIEFVWIGYEFDLDGLDLSWIYLICKDFCGWIWFGWIGFRWIWFGLTCFGWIGSEYDFN